MLGPVVRCEKSKDRWGIRRLSEGIWIKMGCEVGRYRPTMVWWHAQKCPPITDLRRWWADSWTDAASLSMVLCKLRWLLIPYSTSCSSLVRTSFIPLCPSSASECREASAVSFRVVHRWQAAKIAETTQRYPTHATNRTPGSGRTTDFCDLIRWMR